jgi:glycosyltransferase involved in cell wall biosynthesis
MHSRSVLDGVVPPLISVVVPSFNSAFIQECVASVLSQTFENFELVIVDCSAEASSLQAIEGLNHAKIRVFHRSGRHLPGSNRNFGIKRAAGEFIVCLDADDLIEPTFLEEALFVICCVDHSLVGTSMRTFGVMEKTAKLYAHPTLEQVADGDGFVVSILFRKELWRRLGGFKDTALGRDHIPEDWDFFVRAMAAGATLYNRGSYGLRYRKHLASLTAQPDMPSLEEMRGRIRALHGEKLRTRESKGAPPAPAIRKDGWRKLLFDGPRRETGLLILPEKVNDLFVERLRKSIEPKTQVLTVLSTCQMETYPLDFLNFLSEYKSEMFSLPDFLEEQDLWLEFIAYLGESRNVIEVWYGQNGFFIDKLSAISKLLPSCALNYISRY